MQDDRGTSLAQPSRYPHLRCTRVLQPCMVLTIEHGLYFIETLLALWRFSPFSQHFNWSRIENFKPYVVGYPYEHEDISSFATITSKT